MALEQQICHTSNTADCEVFTITDQTGTYDAVDNPGGYGAPNPLRNDLALYLLGYKYKEGEDDEDITAVINNTDPQNVTYWEIANSEDGYYYFDLLTINIWDNLTSYVVDDLVFHNQVFYKALNANNNSEPSDINTDWEIVTDLAAETANTSLVANVRYNMNYTCRIEICYAKVVHDSGAICNGCLDCKGQVLKLYQRLDVLLQSMFINMSQENWIEADKVAQTMVGYCKKTDCRVC
ncbi:MAG: hypothetical protein JSW41_04160 [Candidatus Aenigmatarchaeota archaeon]|nr:MAG: hypothetical protein JSW41_04160 [Candidatus Aenigmarchaeota archaeon]